MISRDQLQHSRHYKLSIAASEGLRTQGIDEIRARMAQVRCKPDPQHTSAFIAGVACLRNLGIGAHLLEIA